MPEGDTIFRSARTLHRALAGRVVTGFESVLPPLITVNEDTPVVGHSIERVESRGKNLLIHFSGGLVLRTHMKMSGSWHIYRRGEHWMRPRDDMRVVIATAEYVAVGFTIPLAEFETTRSLDRNDVLGTLGPDLLAAEVNIAEVVQRMRTRPAEEIAEALLDQRVIAGIGNIFKSETLFVAGVNPFAPVSALDDTVLRRVAETAQRLLKANVRPSSGDGIVTFEALGRRRRRGESPETLWVYRRGGKPCRRCRTPIAWRRQGRYARSTYWCPRCQR